MSDYECTICSDTFTSSKRKKIECKMCKEICCLECFKKYLLSSENITPKCMFCNENISYSYIREICSIHFCNKDLHEKRTKTEMDRQMTLLPATQHLANLEIERRKYWSEIKLYDDRIAELRRELDIIQRQKSHVPWPTLNNINKEENKITFIQKCPIESCNGFLNSSWKCGICETYICSRCHTPKQSRNDPEHVCDEEIVSSISAIKKDSKPCPKCAAYIFKIEGCDQMWCPECKTAFSWRTGKIETGTLHNPHYFEYMRKLNNGLIPRQPGDVPVCDVIPNFGVLWNSISRWKRLNPDKLDISNKINVFFRNRAHFERVDMNRVNIDYQNLYSQLRVRYLLKDITKDGFKFKVSKLLKREERDSEVLEIYNLYLTVTGEVLKNINEMLVNSSPPGDIIKELDNSIRVRNFCNDKLELISRQFKNNIRMIKN